MSKQDVVERFRNAPVYDDGLGPGITITPDFRDKILSEIARLRGALEEIRDMPMKHGRKPEHRTANIMRARATRALEGGKEDG